MQDQLNQILQGVIDNSSQATEFMLAQLPDVIQQLLIWHAVRGGLVFILSLVCFYLIVSFMKNHGGGLLTSVGVIGLFIAGFCGTLGISHLLQIIIAPKIYLIEYAARLVK